MSMNVFGCVSIGRWREELVRESHKLNLPFLKHSPLRCHSFSVVSSLHEDTLHFTFNYVSCG